MGDFFQEILFIFQIEMLDNLLEIEVAYNLITSGNDDKEGKDPIDAHYEKLKTKVSVLPKETDDFKVIFDLFS